MNLKEDDSDDTDDEKVAPDRVRRNPKEGGDGEGRSNSGDSDSSEDESNLSFWQQLKKQFREVKKEFHREVVDYGPPYVDNSTLIPDDLLYECARLTPNHLKIHNILNKRANPNTPDEDDLFFIPLHWAARRNHYQVAEMLIQAHTNVNACTEMGHTPLHLVSMFKPEVLIQSLANGNLFTALGKKLDDIFKLDSRNKRLNRLPFVQLLVENGADVNIRDKGGFSALDFAASNQDVVLVRYLLAKGAKCSLPTQYLVCERDHILSFCTNPEVYKLIKETLDREEAAVAEEERKTEEVRQKLLDEEKARQAALDLYRLKHKNRFLREQHRREVEEAKAQATKEAILKSLNQQMESYNKPVNHAEKWYRAGEWKKDVYDHWEIKIREGFVSNFDKSYTDARDTILRLKHENDYDILGDRWKKAGGNTMQAVYPKNALFDIPGMDHTDTTRKKSKVKQAPQIIVKDKISDVLDFEFKNNNDEALENVDLEQLIDSSNALKPIMKATSSVSKGKLKKS